MKLQRTGILLAAFVTIVEAIEPTCSTHEECAASCSLYMAPSSIPGAGLGLYTAKDLSRGDKVGNDLFIVIEDYYKTVPYKSQQSFLSWLAYIWPEYQDALYPTYSEDAHPPIPDAHYRIDGGLNGVGNDGLAFYEAGEKVSAFCPGVASCANADLEPNLKLKKRKEKKEVTGQAHHKVIFQATQNIPAGSELFINYGQKWHDRYEDMYVNRTKEDYDPTKLEYQTLEEYKPKLDAMTLPTEETKRKALLEREAERAATLKHFKQQLREEDQRMEERRVLREKLFKQDEDGIAFKKTIMEKLKKEEARQATIEKLKAQFEQRREATPLEEKLKQEEKKARREMEERLKKEEQELRRKMEAKLKQEEVEARRKLKEKLNSEVKMKSRFKETLSKMEDDMVVDQDEGEGSDEANDGNDKDAAKEVASVNDEMTEDDSSDDAESDELDSDEKDVDEVTNEKEQGGQAEMTPTWRAENGACVDHIRPRTSKVPDAGKGAFANHFIPAGSVIAPAPLLAINRDDLVIYAADEVTDNYRDVLDLETVLGHELLLNYCYGHPDSPMLLLPYSPVVNYINHDGNKPNAKIRWPSPEDSLLGDPSDWLNLHPVDVMERSGKLMMEFVALRDIEPDEEIFIDYGKEWEASWNQYLKDTQKEKNSTEFRHEIGVPDSFYPNNWINKSAVYEVAPPDAPLKPGEWSRLKWAHNGKPITNGAYKVGLPPGFSNHLRQFADRMGILDLYKSLLYEDVLESNEWFVMDTHDKEQWFAHRFNSDNWNFNMHYVAAWNEAAWQSFLRELGSAGFDVVLEGMAKKFNLDNVTCIHASFMGVTTSDKSKVHADVYASGEKAFNIIFPLILVNGSTPELDIIADDANVMTAVNYEYDMALAMGDWGYHKTSPITYEESGQMRVVLGTYCGQLDDSNAKLLKHIYDGEDPAPFMSKFDTPNREVHWSHEGHRLPK